MTNFLPKGHRILAERLIEGRHIAQQININAQSKHSLFWRGVDAFVNGGAVGSGVKTNVARSWLFV